jgi:branched-chain amino acid transport system ATP-binding protein
MLFLENVSAGYGKVEVLHNISLVINNGETVSIIGANGGGKTTLLRTISGLISSKKGKIVFEDHDITQFTPERIVSLGLIHVPEGRHIFTPLTVYENLLLGVYSKRRQLRKGEREKLFGIIFDLFPILFDRKQQIAGTLSGGEQQMLALGRALMLQPKLLLTDEPSLGLAPLVVKSIFQQLKELNRRGLTIFLVEQNALMALTMAQRAYILDTGHLVLQGEANDLLHNDQIRRIYLGEDIYKGAKPAEKGRHR